MKGIKKLFFLIVLAFFSLACAVVSGPLGLGTATPAAQRPRGEDGPAAAARADRLCLGTFGYGAACLDSAGWQVFQEGGTIGGDQISAVASCPDGRFMVVHTTGLSTQPAPGAAWLEMELTNDQYMDHLVCTLAGEVWGYDYDTLLRLHAGYWYPTPLKQLSLDRPGSRMIVDVEPGPDGEIWVVSTDSVAVSDGSGWKVYGEGQDWEEQVHLSQIAFDGRGRTWLASMEGLYRFASGRLHLEAKRSLFSPTELRIGADGTFWIATNQGVLAYRDGAWQVFTFSDQGLASDTIRDLEIDQRGRVWAATDWGLLVYDGGQWHAFQMHNADLPGNFIMSLLVDGRGPDLPEPLRRQPGSLGGRLLRGEQALSGVALEVCVEYLSTVFETPCAGQPVQARAITRRDGSFTIDNLPTGYYYLAAHVDDKWENITGPGIVPRPVFVPEGGILELGDISVTE